MVLDRWLNLDGVLPESQILLRVMLKVLVLIDLLPVGTAGSSAGMLLFLPLQLLDTQLVACRRDADGEISGEDVIPRWVPSHLDIRQRNTFSM